MSEILGVLFAVFVGILVIPKYADYQRLNNDNSRAAATAQQQKQLDAAATTYIQQNATAIQAAATATVPVVISVANLQGANLLPAAFSATNPYGQAWQVEVLQPSAGNLQALVMSTGGTALSDTQASRIAALVGAAGGFIPANDSGIYAGGSANAYGAFSGWNVATANYTGIAGGHPAALLTFNNGQLQSNALYRNAVPGQPQLNTMNTPLIMASVQTAGAVCATNGAIAQDGNGIVLSCQSGTWQNLSGSGCVANSNDLNTIEDDGRCYNYYGNANSPAGGDWFFLEVFRHVNHGNYYVSQRVTGMTGASVGKVWTRNQQSNTYGVNWSAWTQLADPQVNVWHQGGEGGVISIAGEDGTKMHIETLSGGNLRLVNSPWNAELASVDQSGNLTLNQDGNTNKGWMNPGWGVETWGCSQNGAIAKAAYTLVDGWAWNGKPLHCENGLWSANVTANSVVANGSITPGWAVETWGCSPNGAMGRAEYTTADGWAWNGKPLTCVNGTWTGAWTAGPVGATGPQGPQGVPGVGAGGTMHDVTASRTFNILYWNNTGKVMTIYTSMTFATVGDYSIMLVDGNQIRCNSSPYGSSTCIINVGPGSWYDLSFALLGTHTLTQWIEEY